MCAVIDSAWQIQRYSFGGEDVEDYHLPAESSFSVVYPFGPETPNPELIDGCYDVEWWEIEDGKRTSLARDSFEIKGGGLVTSPPAVKPVLSQFS